uniref:Methyltransferase n=1 Tax=viral metagenome TaxID=1070528 RepID=A0A6C0AZU0_9ZZZZ
MLSIIKNIPNINTLPLVYIFEHLKLSHKPNTLWLEFGVASGRSINYISQFTNDKVYGFDSFEGLPEKWRDGFDKGCFTRDGILPLVSPNVELIKGLFNETLVNFIQTQNKKISFIHMDADLYSSTIYIFDVLKDYIDKDCIIVFDELVNYEGFDGENGELRAFYEFVTKNTVDYEWIGMWGNPYGIWQNFYGMPNSYHESAALIIHSIS